MKKSLALFTCLFCLKMMLTAQAGNGIGVVSGTLLDPVAAPLAYASVSVFDTEKNLVLGVISAEDGRFLLEELPLDTLFLEVAFLGYQTHKQTLLLTKKQKKIALGNIAMQEDAAQLEEIVVTAEKSQYNLKLDKKEFIVGKDALSRGGSAIDILDQVPLVSVEPTGAVTLRGSSQVQILINGRRSGLTLNNALDQIPSENIAKVEVITNPSAAFSAQGSAGIINIVLKKSLGEGWNGQVSVNAGTPADYAVVPGINYRGKKINVFSNLRWRYSDYVGRYSTEQRTLTPSEIFYLDQNENEDRHDDGRSAYFGADFTPDAKNSFTLAFYRSETADTDLTLLNYSTRLGNETPNTFLRTGNSKENRNYNQLEANYTRTFEQKGEKLVFDFQYDFWNSIKNWDLKTTGDILPDNAARDLRTRNKAGSRDYVLQGDYTKPVGEDAKILVGMKFENRLVENEYLAESFEDETWKTFANIDNDVNYAERIAAAYAEYKGKTGKFQYALGLRSEYTFIDITDAEDVFTDANDYINLFPSANIGYLFNEKNTLQIGYTRRINRPNLWSLYPFFEIKDFNIQETGNPNLQPGFTDAAELSYLFAGEKITLNSNVYVKQTADAFQDFIRQNADGGFLIFPINIERRDEAGFELALRYRPTGFLRLNSEFNYYGFAEKGTFAEQNLDADGNAWRARFNADLRLWKELSFQANFGYQSGERAAQLRTFPSYTLSFGASRNFFDDKLTVSLRAFNVLDSRLRRSVYETSTVFLEQRSRRNQERFGVNIMYRFNQSARARLRRANRGNR